MWPEIAMLNLVLLTGVLVGFLIGLIICSADKGEGDYGENSQENQG